MMAQDIGFTQNSTGWITYANSTEYTLTAGEGSRTVYYKVRDNLSNESITVNDSIIISTSPVPTVILVSPANGSYTNETTLTFTWLPVNDAENYEITIDTVTATLGATTSYTAPSLSEGSHTWKVRAKDTLARWGNYSDASTVTIDTTAPSAPVLSTPANGSLTTEAKPVLSWSASTDNLSGIGSYEITLDTTVTTQGPTASFVPGSDLTEGDHAWKVRARDVAGNWSDYSTAWTFTTRYALPAPTVSSISPSTAGNNKSVSVIISGANFQTGAAVKLVKSGSADILATNITVVNAGQINCDFDVKGAKTGAWDVTVANPDGRSGSLLQTFILTSVPPKITSITPDGGKNTGSVNVVISGDDFLSGAEVKLSKTGEGDILGEAIIVESLNRISCRFDLTGRITGLWSVVVKNEDQQGTLPDAFKIESMGLTVVGPVTVPSGPLKPVIETAKIRYNLSQDSDIIINIYNIRGERIWQTMVPAGGDGGTVGANEVEWTGLSGFREVVSNGVYIVHIVAKVNGETKIIGKTKIIVIK